jgi:type IV secretory pathway VirB2 component (pilin)
LAIGSSKGPEEASMTRRSRAVALAAALVFAAFVATDFAAAQDPQPSFRVEEAHLDIGTIVAGTIARATFVFHNDGPDDVNIIRAKPS